MTQSERTPQHYSPDTAEFTVSRRDKAPRHSVEVRALEAVRVAIRDGDTDSLEILAAGKMPFGWDARFQEHLPSMTTGAKSVMEIRNRSKGDGFDGFAAATTKRTPDAAVETAPEPAAPTVAEAPSRWALLEDPALRLMPGEPAEAAAVAGSSEVTQQIAHEPYSERARLVNRSGLLGALAAKNGNGNNAGASSWDGFVNGAPRTYAGAHDGDTRTMDRPPFLEELSEPTGAIHGAGPAGEVTKRFGAIAIPGETTTQIGGPGEATVQFNGMSMPGEARTDVIIRQQPHPEQQ